MSSDHRTKISFRNLLVAPVRNGIYKQKEFHGRGCKIVNMGELFANGRLFDVPMKRVELTEKEMTTSLLQPGDLLFARRSLTAEGAGKCSVVKVVESPTTFESSIIRARPNPQLASSDFLYYYFLSPIGRQTMGTILRQVAVSGITGSDLMGLELECPSLAIQRRIGEFLSSLDDRITLIRETNSTLEAIAQSLFKSWFVDFDPVRAKAEGREPEGLDSETAALFPDGFEESELGLMPRGWKVSALKDICSIASGKRPVTRNDAETDSASIPLYGGAGVMGYTEQALFQEAKIVTGRVGTLGVVNIAYPPFWASDNVLVLSPLSEDTFLFCLHWLAEIDVKALNRGSTQPLLTQKDLGNQRRIVPPAELLEDFAKTLSPIYQMMRTNSERGQVLSRLRDTLLPRLITGQLRIGDAEALLKDAA